MLQGRCKPRRSCAQRNGVETERRICIASSMLGDWLVSVGDFPLLQEVATDAVGNFH